MKRNGNGTKSVLLCIMLFSSRSPFPVPILAHTPFTNHAMMALLNMNNFPHYQYGPAQRLCELNKEWREEHTDFNATNLTMRFFFRSSKWRGCASLTAYNRVRYELILACQICNISSLLFALDFWLDKGLMLFSRNNELMLQKESLWLTSKKKSM